MFRLAPPAFLSTEAGPILDVRAPAEYRQGHVPGALSLPLFTDEERARIGTTYKRVSPEKAVLQGLDYFGPKMRALVEQAQKLAPNRRVRLHCWRGGMRSGAVQWLLTLAGFEVTMLDKGYKEYRRWVLEEVARLRPLRVLGGPTGSGKTAVLRALAAQGQPVLDLEKLAHHQGSSFGALGQPPQPTQEQFENNLAATLAALPVHQPSWVEDESRTIGRLAVPSSLFNQLRAAPLVVLEVPSEARIDYLTADYGRHDAGELAAAVLRLRKRLGGLLTKEILAAIAEDDMRRMVTLVLGYYDKTYAHGLENRPALTVPTATTDAANNAARVLAAVANASAYGS